MGLDVDPISRKYLQYLCLQKYYGEAAGKRAELKDIEVCQMDEDTRWAFRLPMRVPELFPKYIWAAHSVLGHTLQLDLFEPHTRHNRWNYFLNTNSVCPQICKLLNLCLNEQRAQMVDNMGLWSEHIADRYSWVLLGLRCRHPELLLQYMWGVAVDNWPWNIDSMRPVPIYGVNPKKKCNTGHHPSASLVTPCSAHLHCFRCFLLFELYPVLIPPLVEKPEQRYEIHAILGRVASRLYFQNTVIKLGSLEARSQMDGWLFHRRGLELLIDGNGAKSIWFEGKG